MSWIKAKRQFWLTFGLFAGLWTMLGLVSAGQANAIWLDADTLPAARLALFGWQMLVWYFWGALTPLVFVLRKRFPLTGKHWLRHIGLHIVTSLLFAIAHLFFFAWTGRALLPTEMGRVTFSVVLRVLTINQFHFEWLIYWVVLGGAYALDYYQRYRARDLVAAQLERQLIEAQLQALKMQLHPHFLFNTLNTIATLARKQDTDAVVQMLAGLGDLLRYTLEQVDKQEVPLKDELEFIERYLAIEQARFRDRLTVRMEIAPDTLTAAVPSLILQPLVENAVRYGVAARAAAGVIELKAMCEGEQLHLLVCDNGPGLPKDFPAENEGVGLSNTRARLERLYGDEHGFALRNGVGLTVEIVIPFRSVEPTHNN